MYIDGTKPEGFNVISCHIKSTDRPAEILPKSTERIMIHNEIMSSHLRSLVLGADMQIPLLDGTQVPYINFDNAASTPCFIAVKKALDQFIPYYASVNRSGGFKSRISSMLHTQARKTIGDFVNADLTRNAVILVKNATEALNRVADYLPPGSTVVVTGLEHHSNDLPWRHRHHVVHIPVLSDGSVNMEAFAATLKGQTGKVSLVAVSGASNVTGIMQPIHRLARLAHEAGARILVDAAQLIAHCSIDMKPDHDPRHLDFLAFSGHKMYAPFGAGVLIGPNEFFARHEPVCRGGGMVNTVTFEDAHWKDVPEREEAGTPNLVGAIAIATAMKTLRQTGLKTIDAHERALFLHALRKLRTIPGITIYGDDHPCEQRLAIVSFNLVNISHAKLAAILTYEGGIGLRNGCFCAHPYVTTLLNLTESEKQRWRTQTIHNDRTDLPGMVRISFGCYNTTSEIDRFVELLRRIAKGRFQAAHYRLDRKSGNYFPDQDDSLLASYFSLNQPSDCQ